MHDSYARNLMNQLNNGKKLSGDDLLAILLCSNEDAEYLQNLAERMTIACFGKGILIRGLIEISNICSNDCYYCGIRASNDKIPRYCLTTEQIMESCERAYKLGFRTFVLQGGENHRLSDMEIASIVARLKDRYEDCAVTLSLGERSRESYAMLKSAGADRYLLREETVNPKLYEKLHPSFMSHSNRMKCLETLKELWYQTGCGFMVGVPHQTMNDIIDDLLFIQEFEPAMVGIGPFIPEKDTPFGREEKGPLTLTLKLIALLRLMDNHLLIPATTALGTLVPGGRELGIRWGANVVMPNISPEFTRDKYLLYDNKLNTKAESVEGLKLLEKSLAEIDRKIVFSRGDYYKFYE